MRILKTVGVIVTFAYVIAIAIANPSSLESIRRRCFVDNTWYDAGDTFKHTFKRSPCIFTCTCVLKRVQNHYIPTGSCVHRCPVFKYPPHGCKPLSDGCCTTSYVCPDGEKCKDDQTGMLYGIGQKWKLNSTCECTCLGEGVGKYQCRCLRKKPQKIISVEDKEKGFENPCIPDDSQSCRACPMGMTTCPIRAKCETWPHTINDIDLDCTCYGSKGTRCVSKSAADRQEEIDNMKKAENTETAEEGKQENVTRRKRWIHDSTFEIYFNEEITSSVEVTVTRIDTALGTFT